MEAERKMEKKSRTTERREEKNIRMGEKKKKKNKNRKFSKNFFII